MLLSSGLKYTALDSGVAASAANSWDVVQRQHSQLQWGNTVGLKVHLLQSILVPCPVATCFCRPLALSGFNSSGVTCGRGTRVWP